MQSPIKEIRDQLNLSQQKMTEMSGVSQGHISGIERGFSAPYSKLLNFLESIHFDIQDIKNKQVKFMEQHKKENLDLVKNLTENN